MDTSENKLELSIRNGVKCIRFNRPNKKNAVSYDMYEDITNILNNDAKDDNVKICIITGNGDYFSSGNDITTNMAKGLENPEEFKQTATDRVKQFVKAFIDYPKLLIAVVNGPAIGIGATILGLCDVVYASDRASFQTPFAKLGLCPEGCSSYMFPLLMGKSKAMEMLLLNHKMTASEALRVGFVAEVFQHSHLRSVLDKIYNNYAEVPLESIQITKALTRKWDKNVLHEVNEREMKQLGDCFDTDTFINAAMQFINRKSKM